MRLQVKLFSQNIVDFKLFIKAKYTIRLYSFEGKVTFPKALGSLVNINDMQGICFELNAILC